MPGTDFTAFDEIQTIVFQERSEIQAALKAYLEQGKTTIDNFEFIADCGLMLMGNIDLDDNRRPMSRKYFDKLPESFRESALLDRFHCFIEGWYLPRINKEMIFKGWTVNVEYFSEALHTLRTQTIYGQLFDELVGYEKQADNRDFNAVNFCFLIGLRLRMSTVKNLIPIVYNLLFIAGVLLKNNVITLTLNLKFKCLIFGLLGTINSAYFFKSNFKVYPLKCS